MDLDTLLRQMTEMEASDLHLKPRRPPLFRLHGKLAPVDGHEPVHLEDLEQMLESIMTPIQRRRLEEHMSVDLGYGVHGVARFRGNIYMQRGCVAAVFRRIPYDILSVDDLDLPDQLLEFCDMSMGLVLVTGPTGSGKSTTLAALIRHITSRDPGHIITIEDPMEFLFSDGKSSVSQREIGTDTGSFAEALRNAMRQDPDVIMVGEMRDPETVHTVITAAETGHLVFSTLHTNSSTQTIDRILDTFPPEQQGQVRAQLAQVLKGVVSMKLVRRADGKGLVGALEILRGSPKVADLIEKGLTSKLHEELESSVSYYRMQSMNQSLLSLLVHSEITYDEAVKQSPDPEDLSLKLRRMFPELEKPGGEMSPSAADFSQIQELQQFRRLYQEQDEKVKLQMAEKDQEVDNARSILTERNQELAEQRARVTELEGEIEKLNANFNRLRGEAQEKVDKLMERIKELNQKLVGAK